MLVKRENIVRLIAGFALSIALPVSALAAPKHKRDQSRNAPSAYEYQLQDRSQTRHFRDLGGLQFVQNQTDRKISASQAKSAAQRSYPNARYVNAQLVNSSTYRVRLQQKNGQIVDVYVDARTGRVKN